MRIRYFLAVLILSANAYAGTGTTAANFLKFSVSAREAALAGSYCALAQGPSALFSNPAGLSDLQGKELLGGFTSYIQDAKLGIISYAMPYKNASLGFGAAFFNIDGIEKRGLTDLTGIMSESGSFSANDLAVILSYAKKNWLKALIDDTDMGVSLKFVNSKIDDSSAFALAADIGVLHKYSQNVLIGFSALNFGTEMKYEQESDPLPATIKGGILYSVKDNFKLSGELSQYIYESKFYPSVSAEYALKEGFFLRGGYKFGYDTGNLGALAGLGAGFGLNAKSASFDYAYVPFGDLGNIHKFDFSIKF